MLYSHNFAEDSAMFQAHYFYFSELFKPFYYLGPDSIMPLASVLAAIVGFILIFWRWIAGFFKKLFRISSKQAQDSISNESIESQSNTETHDKGMS